MTAATLRRLITGFHSTYLIYVVAELGIADLLEDGPKSSAELAAHVSTDPDALHRVLRGLAQFGVLGILEDGRFELTDLGDALRTDAPNSLRPVARLWGGPLVQRPFGGLLNAVQTGQPAFPQVFGQPLFDYLAAHPAEAAIFNQGMVGMTSQFVDSVLSDYDFSEMRTVADVGGGNGALILAILQAHPGLSGIVVDLPHVREGVQRAIAAAGLAERCRFVAGDFFEAVPDGADAYLLKSILHDWDDPKSLTILRNCRRAMQPHGKLLVIERLLPPGNQLALDPVMKDIEMLVMLGSRERTEAEYRALFEQAGFRMDQSIPLQGGTHLLEGVPA
jgi:SAM-dependent methyltransferase